MVAGGGYAGLSAFGELADRGPRLELLLVSATPYHYFVTEFPALVAGGVEEEGVRVSLRRFVAARGRLVVGSVDRVEPGPRRLVLAGGESLPYDYLILAVGGEAEFFRIPGAREHGLEVGNPAAARQLAARVAGLVEGGGPRRVVIAGGGLTGVEVAGELAERYPDRLQITVVEAAPALMPGFDPILAREAQRVLEEKGVRVRTGTKIVSVDPAHVHVEQGPALPYDLLVWAGGVRGSPVLARSGLPVTPRGRVKVDPLLRAEGFPEIYVAGDAASFTDPATGQELPPSAQLAVQMGRHAARNLLRRLAGRDEVPFQPRLLGAFATLGGREAVGYVGAGRFTGLPAVVIKRLIEAHHAVETGGLIPVLARYARPWARRLALRTLRPRPGLRPGGLEVAAGENGRIAPSPGEVSPA